MGNTVRKSFARKARSLSDSNSSSDELPDVPGKPIINTGGITGNDSILIPDEKPETCLDIKDLPFSIDYRAKHNAISSSTEQYDLVELHDTLVIRRGEAFAVNVKFNRDFIPKYDDVKITFTYTTKRSNDSQDPIIPNYDPSISNKTLRSCQMSENGDWSSDSTHEFAARLHEIDLDNDTIVIMVRTPVDAIIGKYFIHLELSTEGQGVTKFTLPKPLYLIFNPWNKEDPVYLDDDDKLDEYVLADRGQLYRGSTENWAPKKWLFGQFEEKILDSAIEILLKDSRQSENSFRNLEKLSKPWYVARVLSLAINEFILQGNWDGAWKDGSGASPSSWNGSVKILQQYFDTQEKVKYGQCWVFSGITVTLCRALGIPARSITCFDSAHDTDETMTIDTYRDENGDEIDELESDKVWNFHVWAEVWMSRPDFPEEVDYDGWQVIDATPQEESFKEYQCGPAPVKAIKLGRIDCGFEAPFVYGEVNADRCQWLATKDENGEYAIEKLVHQRTAACGNNISTKSVGSDSREDVTSHYKPREGTQEERDAFTTAFRFGKGRDYNMRISDKKPEFELKIEKISESFILGEPIKVKAVLKSNTTKKLSFVGGLYSTGAIDSSSCKKKNLIKRNIGEIDVNAEEPCEIEFEFKAVDYFSDVTQSNLLKFSLQVVENSSASESLKSRDVADFSIYLDSPEDVFSFYVNSEAKVGNELKATIEVKNIFQTELTNCKFTVEGQNMGHDVQKIQSIAVGETKSFDITLNPKKSGSKLVCCDLDCDQINDVQGYYEFEVE